MPLIYDGCATIATSYAHERKSANVQVLFIVPTKDVRSLSRDYVTSCIIVKFARLDDLSFIRATFHKFSRLLNLSPFEKSHLKSHPYKALKIGIAYNKTESITE